MTNPISPEARELLAAENPGCGFAFAVLEVAALRAIDKALSRPAPQQHGGDALVGRLRGHAAGLKEHERYDPAAQSGLTNADAVSYGGLLDEAAAALSTPPRHGEEEVEDLTAAIHKSWLKCVPCGMDLCKSLPCTCATLTAQAMLKHRPGNEGERETTCDKV